LPSEPSPMENRTAHILVFDGFADWEPASALAELRRTFGFSVQTVGVTKNVVTSMGGIRVLPDLDISEVQPKLTRILILPGGDVWMREEIGEVTRLIKDLIESDRPVAAICAATLSLARAGLLDDRRHTSNGYAFIPKYVAKYRGRGLYQRVRAVADRNVITANGLAPFAFAAEIFRKLAPDRENDIATYEALYSRGLLDDLQNSKNETKERLVSVDIKPDYLYSPQEVASVLSVSYDTATRIMGGMTRVANFAKPRAKKRLLRIKGSDLRAYIQNKLEG
jgi:putative intracellular protease/amidase